MTVELPIICFACTRMHPTAPGEHKTCDAFKEGIPREITAGLDDHTEPVGGDDGLQFNLDPRKQKVMDLYYDWINSPEGETYKTMVQEFWSEGDVGNA